MATVSGTFTGRTNYRLDISVNQSSQNVSSNYSVVSIVVSVTRTSGTGSWSSAPLTWNASVNGAGYSGSTGYDFRNYTTLTLLNTTQVVYHNADGTKTIGFSASAGGGTTIGSASTPGGGLTLSTIPRASTISWATGGDKFAGQTYQLNTNRASTSFTHTITWAFGTASGTVGTGVTDNVNWTIPLTLLNEIPNSLTGNGTFTTTTYNGATVIGTTTSSFVVTTPVDVIPTWTSVSIAEGAPGVAAKIGAGVYVQGISKPSYTITGAAGVYGSSISAQTFKLESQVVNGPSGTVTNAIAGSGTVVATHEITDSRGRKKSQNTNLTVLPYATPTYVNVTTARALSDGTVDPDNGTYLKVTLTTASVSSLINGTQKNSIQIKTRVRVRGSSTPWTDPSTLKDTFNPGGISYTGSRTVAGPFAVGTAYEVRIEIADIFNITGVNSTISVASVFMHWGTGLAVGKYWEQGALDVGPGGIYDNGVKVLNDNDVKVVTGILDATYRGGAQAKVKIDGDSVLTGPYSWASPYDPQASRNVRLLKQGSTYQILGQTEDGVYPLTLGTNWYTYEALTNAGMFNGQPRATLLKSGLVVLSGLLRVNGSVADASVIASFPAELAPDSSLLMPVLNNDQIGTIKINTNGTITAYGTPVGNGYISLDGVAFWPAAANVPWTVVGSGGSSFGANFEVWSSGTSEWGQVKYFKDVYGFVWFQGLVRIKVSPTADNTNIITLPTTHRADQQGHFRAAGPPGVWVGVGALSTNGLNWKTNSVSGVGQYISVSGVVFTTTDAVNNNPWKGIATLANGWGFYSGFVSATLRREDGLCMARGMLTPSTMNATVFILPERELYPRAGRLIIAGMSNNANSRTDISAITEITAGIGPGVVQFGMGSSWMSLDTLKWVP